MTFPFLRKLAVGRGCSAFSLRSGVPVNRISGLERSSLTRFSERLDGGAKSSGLAVDFSKRSINSVFFSLRGRTVGGFVRGLASLTDSSSRGFLGLGFRVRGGYISKDVEVCSLVSFTDFIKSLRALQFLEVVGASLGGCESLCFGVIDRRRVSFFSEGVCFSSDREGVSGDSCSPTSLGSQRIYCFTGRSRCPCSPGRFGPVRRRNNPDRVLGGLIHLALVFSVIGVFSIASVRRGVLACGLGNCGAVRNAVSVSGGRVALGSIGACFGVYR